MKNLRVLFIAFLFSLLAFSCGNSPEKEISEEPKSELDEYKNNLPGYSWLDNSDNYTHESFKDSVFYYFHTNLKAKNYEDAALYILTYTEVLRNTMQYDSLFYHDSENLLQDHQDKLSGESRTKLMYYLGTQSHLKHDLTQSSEWLRKAMAIPVESKDHKQIIGFSNFAIAQNYSMQREFEKAEEHLVEALRIFEEVEDLKNQGTVNLLLFNMYMQKSAYKEAEVYLERGLQIVKKQKSEPLTFSAYSMYVNLNVAKTDTLHAITYIDSLAVFAEAHPNIPNYHKTIANQLLAFKHIAKREEKDAVEYLKKARELSDASQSPDLQMRTLFQELMFTEIFDKPLENVEEVEEFYNEIAASDEPNRQYMSQMGAALFKFYRKKGKHEKANLYASFLMEDKNKALEEAVNSRLFELEQKYQAEQKEKKILLQDKQLEAQKKWIVSLVVAVVFIFLLLTLLIVWNKNRSILREQKLTENFTSQLLTKTEDERKRIASDLHDSVSNELVNLRHELENHSFLYKDKIDTILSEVRNISRNLSPTLFDKLGLQQSVEQLTDRAQNQHSFLLTSEIDYSASLNLEKELQLYRIIQEATTNIIKHADAIAGKITIWEDANYVFVEIKDNGKGFDADKMLESGNCFGLLNIKERAKFMGGTVQIKSGKNGTEIKVSLPKKQ